MWEKTLVSMQWYVAPVQEHVSCLHTLVSPGTAAGESGSTATPEELPRLGVGSCEQHPDMLLLSPL